MNPAGEDIVSIELKEQLRAIAMVLHGDHAGISVSYIDALDRAATQLEDQKGKSDLSERLRYHAEALASPGVIAMEPLIETINEAVDCM